MSRTLHVLAITSLVAACAPARTAGTGSASGPGTSASTTAAQAPATAPEAPPRPEVVDVSLADVGLEPAAMDASADPCSDFFRYACGGWLDATEIPADQSQYGRFAELHQRNETAQREILEQAAAAPAGENAQLGAFYGACMDEPAIERARLSGVEPLLARVRTARNPATIAAAITELHRHGIWVIFSPSVHPDFVDSTVNLLFLDTGGLGLPDRDYYLGDDATFVKAREHYLGHVARMLVHAGMKQRAAARAAADVVAFETELARVTRTRVERNDVTKLYNKMDRAGLAALTPRFAWDGYFQALGRPDVAAVSVTTPAYFERLDQLLATTPAATWRHYLTWQIIHQSADSLPRAFVDEHFALVSGLTGQAEQKPRWKRCVEATDGALGEALGQRFVAVHFPGESKSAAERMVHEITAAFTAEVARLSWMSEATKAQAAAKLARMSWLIGYPERWKSYDFDIDRQSFAASVLRARAFEIQRELAKAGRPHDRSEWQMTPQTVNAYYDGLANQMVFPAGILQPPFFGAGRGVAANLGAIGMVVGHELTHGFDDQGSKFDGDGNMRNWWQAADATTFSAKGECLAAQYSTFEILPGLRVNGKLTLGENIADLGGVKLAYRAYRRLRAGAPQVYVAGGLTEDQQFFVGMGQAWCTETREAEIQRRVVVDSHAPPKFRVMGALRNLPEFAAAFQCASGTPMHPTDTCEIW
jgi:putative endopeptidase